VMALVGDNGAGKSTLIKGIAGIHTFDDGEMLFDGQPVSINSPRDSANEASLVASTMVGSSSTRARSTLPRTRA